MVRLLHNTCKELRIVSINGGVAHNAIPANTKCTVAVKCENFAENIKKVFA
jgi:hypothetical protein